MAEDKISIEPKRRTRYHPKTRIRAGEMYVFQQKTIKDIAEELQIPEGTIGRWSAEDFWEQDRNENKQDSFSVTRSNIIRTIRRLSQRLFESTIPPDDEDVDFVLPDQHLELRITRLTHALKHIMPLGTLVLMKQRIDVVDEIKRYGFDCSGRGEFTESELAIGSRLLESYIGSLDKSENG